MLYENSAFIKNRLVFPNCWFDSISKGEKENATPVSASDRFISNKVPEPYRICESFEKLPAMLMCPKSHEGAKSKANQHCKKYKSIHS